MHFAYPPRKDSNPPPFRPRSSKLPLLRRNRLKAAFLILGAFLFGFWLLSGGGDDETGGTYYEHVPSGNPPVVIVTVLDPVSYSSSYLESIKENRELYAQRHGYEAMVVRSIDYDTGEAPPSWAKPMAMRDAASKYPDASFIWHLDQDAFIMDPSRTLDELVTDSRTLEGLMVKDYPVVPPDSIIKTFSHLRGTEADMIISQDADGLVSDNLVVRNGDWAKFFLETWYDPLFRTYNFQRAERHALEHIVQWHPSVLSKLALIPQRTLASYTHIDLGQVYEDGDFVVMFAGCSPDESPTCESEAVPYEKKWRAAFGAS